MNGASRKWALRRATLYVKHEGNMRDVVSSEAALALLLLGHDKGQTRFCRQLVNILCRDKEGVWIRDNSLKDVVLSLLALYTYDPKIVSGAYIAQLAKRLVSHERMVGGPYAQLHAEPDLETNAIIAQLFQAFGTPLLPTMDFLQTMSRLHSPGSQPSPFLMWPRILPGIDKKDVVSQTDHIAAVVTTDTLFMQIVTHTLTMHQIQPELVDILIETQREDGAWRIEGASVWFSTILARKILILYGTPYKKNEIPEEECIVLGITKRFLELKEPVRTTALAMQEAVVSVDPRHEITHLARSFAESLHDCSPLITNEVCTALGMANFYFWVAYTIYDDFIDDEGDPTQLSLANIAQRDSQYLYEKELSAMTVANRTIRAYFDDVDEANAWELSSCRMKIERDCIIFDEVPDYSDKAVLARRAAGHILGPLIVAEIQAGCVDARTQDVYAGLNHYLIARQLNDDLHDWMDDLKQGHMSYVVAYLLASLQLAPGCYALDALYNRIRTFLWDGGLAALCDEIEGHASRAREFLRKSTLLQEAGVFYHYLDFVDAVIEASRRAYADQREFLREYSESTNG